MSVNGIMDRAIDGSDVVVVMLKRFSLSTVDCNCTMLRQQRSLSSTKTVLLPDKTPFVVEM